MEKENKEVKKHSIHLILILGAFLLLGSFGLGLFVQKSALVLAFDGFFYNLIHIKGKNAFLDIIVRPFDLWFFPKPFNKILFMPAYFYFLLVGFILFFLKFKKSELFWGLLNLLIGFILAGILLQLHWLFLFRERPFTIFPHNMDQSVMNALKRWPSFPSGHVRDTMVFATIASYYFPKSVPFWIAFVSVVSFGRVYSGAHFPTDVLGGILFGFLTGKISILITQEFRLSAPNISKKFSKK